MRDRTEAAPDPRAHRPTWLPAAIRISLRTSELALIAASAVVGAVTGVLVALISTVTQGLHRAVFQLDPGERLSGAAGIPPLATLAAPAFGGLVLGAIALVLRWRRQRTRPSRTGAPPAPVDAIEANALHGGRMSLKDSLLVVGQNIVSNGSGASVGLEAAYTQIGAALASRLGLAVEARRGDLRILVGCGAAAAIAAAFDAPLTGAFYAFELVVGTYAVASLAPVMTASLAGALVTRTLAGSPSYVISVGDLPPVRGLDYLPALLLGVVCALFGIGLMRAVAGIEAALRRARLPGPLRPALGGLAVGGLGLVSVQALSAGHGALHINLGNPGATISGTLLVLAVKTLASAISLGAGFRGGLFFASLLLGALIGKLFALAQPTLLPFDETASTVFALVGMSSLAAAVVGGPLTMTFLALEVTGNFPITALALAGALAASVTVRKTFGYSFATWRFHLRGESIRSAADIGWIRSLTVGRLMRRDVRTVREDLSLAAFRRAFPLGSAQRVVLVDEAERYSGIVLVPEAHARTLDEAATASGARLAELARFQDVALTPRLNVKEAAALFDAAEAEALAVVDDVQTRRVVGLLTESHTLRRYSEELDQRRREIVGEL